jgi:hypothetical protein
MNSIRAENENQKLVKKQLKKADRRGWILESHDSLLLVLLVTFGSSHQGNRLREKSLMLKKLLLLFSCINKHKYYK